MRISIVVLCTLLAAATAPARAQSTPAPAAPCVPRDGTLAGGIGRATVVTFTGAVYGERVCALVANLPVDGYAAAIEPAADDAVVTVPVAAGAGAQLAVRPTGLFLGAAGTVADAGALAVGPFVIAPGGAFGTFNGDASEVPRVVLAYAGQRMLLIRTSAIALLDLAHALREQSSLFGSDAAERAVVLATGDAAAMRVRTVDGILGTDVTAPRTLVIKQR